MYFCILCSKQGSKSELISITGELTGCLTVADSIEIYFPFITILTDELHKICLECHSVLKNFHELLDSVKLMYEFQDLPMIKCEALDPVPVTSEMIYEPELKIKIKEEKNYIMKDLKVVVDLLPIPKGKRTLSQLEVSELSKNKKRKLNETRKRKVEESDESDDDYVPPSLKPKGGKPGRPRVDTPKKVQIRFNREIRAEQDEKIRQNVEVKCHFCDIPFETFFQVHKHFMKEHPGFTQSKHRKAFLVCCGIKFTMRTRLLDHITSHESGGGFSCDNCCDRVFSNKDGLRNHMRDYHLGDQTPSTCPVCNKTFRNEKFMTKHKGVHEEDPDKSFQCYKCERFFKTFHHLKFHFSDKHAIRKSDPFFAPPKKRSFMCEVCSKVFHEKSRYKSHMEVHQHQAAIERGEGLKCPQCDRLFGSEKKLNLHVTKVHSDYRLICEICSKELKNIASLKGHMEAMHCDEPKERIPCKICGNTFRTEKSLKTHMNNHIERVFSCKQCDFVTKTKGSLRGHEYNFHTLQRILPCQYCSKMLKTELDRKEHEATHTGIDLYQCEFCQKSFKFGASYRGHRKRVHPEEYELTKPKWMARKNMNEINQEKSSFYVSNSEK